MVVSNDVLDDQLQACSGGIDPTSESVLSIRIKTRFVGRKRDGIPSEAHGGWEKMRRTTSHDRGASNSTYASHRQVASLVISLRRNRGIELS